MIKRTHINNNVKRNKGQYVIAWVMAFFISILIPQGILLIPVSDDNNVYYIKSRGMLLNDNWKIVKNEDNKIFIFNEDKIKPELILTKEYIFDNANISPL